MKIFTPIYLIIGLFLAITWVGMPSAAQSGKVETAEDAMEAAGKAIRNGNAPKLTTYLNDLVELNISEKRASYSKTQAEFVLSDFFKKYPALNFSYVHKGTSQDGLAYGIGNYTYEGGAFRVYMLVKQNRDGYAIDTIDFGEE